ncbi:prt domain protein [Enterobacteriaceae bacterium ATCC 29904]|nr:prt domain protein [Enterobacteriaceae bacterium ATCC 29904]
MTNLLSTALHAAKDINEMIALVASLRKHQTDVGRASYVVTSKGAEVKTAFKM